MAHTFIWISICRLWQGLQSGYNTSLSSPSITISAPGDRCYYVTNDGCEATEWRVHSYMHKIAHFFIPSQACRAVSYPERLISWAPAATDEGLQLLFFKVQSDSFLDFFNSIWEGCQGRRGGNRKPVGSIWRTEMILQSTRRTNTLPFLPLWGLSET